MMVIGTKLSFYYYPNLSKSFCSYFKYLGYENDDVDIDGAGTTGAIVLPSFPHGVKFTITSTMLQMLNLKGLFCYDPSLGLRCYIVNENPEEPQTSFLSIHGTFLVAEAKLKQITHKGIYFLLNRHVGMYN